LEIATSKEFAEAWAYVDSLLTTQGKGAIATEVVRDFLIKSYPELFGDVDYSKVEIDLTGQNLGDYWFDIIGRDWSKKELFFMGEAKSEWRDWRPYSMLEEAEKDINDHMENAIDMIKTLEKVKKFSESGWKTTKKGYVFVVHLIPNEIETWWREVDLSGVIERG